MKQNYFQVDIQNIKPYENNPRINDDAVNDVAESIKQCTYISPIIIDENYIILAGHTRFKALQKLNYKECTVLQVLDLTEEEKKKFRLYDNKVQEFSQWDLDKLIEETYNLDFENYDFGQPLQDREEKEKNQKIRNKNNSVVCPCCGEVFEC